jgi:transaldolase
MISARPASVRIYIDSADRDAIKEALATGYVYGVTTNPTLVRRAGMRAHEVPDLARFAFSHGAKEIHLQTFADDTEGIIKEGIEFAALDPARVVVKIPATPQGYTAAAKLAEEGLRTTLTAVYTVRQVILAHGVGAHYIAVYLGRMRDAGLDALAVFGQMQRAIDVQHSQLEILAASLRDPVEIEALVELGVATATLPLDVLRQLPDSTYTSAAAETFRQDARAIR